jgi:ubiquitin carboxyl-terminal hydrolase 7
MQQVTATGGYTDAKEFYDYLLNRINVEFVPKFLSDPEEPTFTLTLSKKMTYDQLCAKVGEHLKIDPTHLRFTTVNASGRPKMAVKHGFGGGLGTILQPSTYHYAGNMLQKPDALFYETLEMSLKELESRKLVRVSWLPEGISKEVSEGQALSHIIEH